MSFGQRYVYFKRITQKRSGVSVHLLATYPFPVQVKNSIFFFKIMIKNFKNLQLSRKDCYTLNNGLQETRQWTLQKDFQQGTELKQWSSNFSVHHNLLQSLIKHGLLSSTHRVTDSIGVGRGPMNLHFLITDDDTDATYPGTTLSKPPNQTPSLQPHFLPNVQLNKSTV